MPSTSNISKPNGRVKKIRLVFEKFSNFPFRTIFLSASRSPRRRRTASSAFFDRLNSPEVEARRALRCKRRSLQRFRSAVADVRELAERFPGGGRRNRANRAVAHHEVDDARVPRAEEPLRVRIIARRRERVRFRNGAAQRPVATVRIRRGEVVLVVPPSDGIAASPEVASTVETRLARFRSGGRGRF